MEKIKHISLSVSFLLSCLERHLIDTYCLKTLTRKALRKGHILFLCCCLCAGSNVGEGTTHIYSKGFSVIPCCGNWKSSRCMFLGWRREWQ